MASLGELFVELGVVGDVKPLEKALGTMKEAVKQIDKEIAANKRLLRYKNDLAKATSESEKKIIKENFVKEIQKEKTLDEINSTQKVINGKQELAGKISSLVTGIGVFVGALAGAAFALNRLTNELVQSNQAMLNLTRTTDIAQSTFQKWGGIGKLLRVEDADQQLAGLNERLFDLMLTGQGARGFQLAGVNPIGQDANGVLEQLRARISGMNDTAASYLLQQMGLDPKMLHLLRMSRAEFEALGQTIQKYQLTPEQSHQIQQMNMQLQIAGLKLKYLKDRAILAIMPYWVKFVEMIAKGAEALSNIITWIAKSNNGWATTIRVILKVLAGATALVAVLVTVPKIIKGITLAVQGLRMALTLLSAHPIIAAITAVVGALMLLADDISHYMNGGGSVIGVIAKGLEDLDIKGFIDFPVPKWLEYLIQVIDFFRGGGRIEIANYNEKKLKQVLNDPYVTKVKQKDGSYNFAEIPPEALPDLSSNTINSVRNTNKSSMVNSNNTNTNKISQNIEIYTNQPASDIDRQLRYASRVFAV